MPVAVFVLAPPWQPGGGLGHGQVGVLRPPLAAPQVAALPREEARVEAEAEDAVRRDRDLTIEGKRLVKG